MRTFLTVYSVTLIVVGFGCGSDKNDTIPATDGSVEGCVSNDECKGVRVCIDNRCIYPQDTGASDVIGPADVIDSGVDVGIDNRTDAEVVGDAKVTVDAVANADPCGNGVIDDGEECDGTELAGESCENLNLGEGVLACDQNSCSFDVSACSGTTYSGGFGCRPGEDLIIDRVSQVVYAPAAVRVTFRVLNCDEYPVRSLESGDVTVVNDETGRDFNDSQEGGGASAPDVPSDYGLYSILALDMSDSIFNNDAVDDVVDGAQVFIQKMVSEPEGNLKQRVAILVFGRTNATRVVLDFTDDADALNATLEDLRDSESLGTTNLYGAYMTALDTVSRAGQNLELVERSVVIMTDGTHEAGDEENMRQQALSAKQTAERNASVTSFSIGIEGTYDESKLKELASKPDYFVMAEDADQLESIFEDVASRVDALAKSNYVVGVCTPIELGTPTLTIEIDVDDAKASNTVPYSTVILTGDVASCDPEMVADPCQDIQCGAGALVGFNCGACESPTEYCDESGVCVDDCDELECGWSPTMSYSCGSCGDPTPDCVDGKCVNEDVDAGN